MKKTDMQVPHEFVYKIFDPQANMFCSSGHGIYSRGRTIWNGKGAAISALSHMPEEIRDRLVVRKYKLIEVIDNEN